MGNMDMANFIGMASNFANMASVGGGMGPPMANNSMGMLAGGGDNRHVKSLLINFIFSTDVLNILCWNQDSRGTDIFSALA